MASNDQGKIEIAREYFMRADQGRPDILELFHEDAEIYFPKFGFGSGRNSFLEMVKGFEGSSEYIQHDYGHFTFIPSGDYLVMPLGLNSAFHYKISRPSTPRSDIDARVMAVESGPEMMMEMAFEKCIAIVAKGQAQVCAPI